MRHAVDLARRRSTIAVAPQYLDVIGPPGLGQVAMLPGGPGGAGAGIGRRTKKRTGVAVEDDVFRMEDWQLADSAFWKDACWVPVSAPRGGADDPAPARLTV